MGAKIRQITILGTEKGVLNFQQKRGVEDTAILEAKLLKTEEACTLGAAKLQKLEISAKKESLNFRQATNSFSVNWTTN